MKQKKSFLHFYVAKRAAHFWDFFSSGGSRNAIKILILVVVAATIPLTVFIARQQQDVRQRASTNSTCVNQVFTECMAQSGYGDTLSIGACQNAYGLSAATRDCGSTHNCGGEPDPDEDPDGYQEYQSCREENQSIQGCLNEHVSWYQECVGLISSCQVQANNDPSCTESEACTQSSGADCSACNAQPNTCGNNNGTKSCTLDRGAPGCIPVPNGVQQSCGTPNCNAGYTCNGNQCQQQAVTCNQDVILGANPSEARRGQTINFVINQGDASTFENNTTNGFSASICTGSWNNKNCVIPQSANPGNYTWTHTWKHCEGSTSNCSNTCTASVPFTILSNTTVSPSPTRTPTPTRVPTARPATPTVRQITPTRTPTPRPGTPTLRPTATIRPTATTRPSPIPTTCSGGTCTTIVPTATDEPTATTEPVVTDEPTTTSGPTATTGPTVPVTPGVGIPTVFRVANTSDANWDTITEQPYTSTPTNIDWTLTSGPAGLRTVYVRFKVNGVWENPVADSVMYSPQTTSITPRPGDMLFALSVKLQAVGILPGENTTPLTKERVVTLEMLDKNGAVASTKNANVTYDANNGKFVGLANSGDIPEGDYQIRIKTDRYLKKVFPGIQHITKSNQQQTVLLPQIALIVGDITGDNVINILDYNILRDCGYGALDPQPMATSTLFKSAACTGHTQQAAADLDDNGIIDAVDYNLFIRSLIAQEGD